MGNNREDLIVSIFGAPSVERNKILMHITIGLCEQCCCCCFTKHLIVLPQKPSHPFILKKVRSISLLHYLRTSDHYIKLCCIYIHSVRIIGHFFVFFKKTRNCLKRKTIHLSETDSSDIDNENIDVLIILTVLHFFVERHISNSHI